MNPTSLPCWLILTRMLLIDTMPVKLSRLRLSLAANVTRPRSYTHQEGVPVPSSRQTHHNQAGRQELQHTKQIRSSLSISSCKRTQPGPASATAIYIGFQWAARQGEVRRTSDVSGERGGGRLVTRAERAEQDKDLWTILTGLDQPGSTRHGSAGSQGQRAIYQKG